MRAALVQKTKFNTYYNNKVVNLLERHVHWFKAINYNITGIQILTTSWFF